jgi:hypothetical protein
VSSIFDRVDPDTLLENTGSGGYSSPVNDGFVDWDEKRGEYSSTDEFLNRNPKTGTYESESYKKEKEKYSAPGPSNEPYTFPSFRGSAISVQDKLANISFVEGSAGEMSASIAYIRYWSRKGTQQKTAVSDAPIDGAVSDPLEQLVSDFNGQFQPRVVFNPITESFSEAGQPVISSSDESTLFQPPARTILTTPTNTAYQSRPRQPQPVTTTASRAAGPSFLNRLGSIFSANPGGSAAPAWANPFYTPAAAPDPDGAVWQFLFNPEELQLSSGPDYNRAETWGVADPANSGQPLSWRSNKNRKLTFGKVLLHGYTFGKRVDSLENGLQQLFQARDGENGADGPPVLEFVWGQRVFGPCVIQNIQVREKAWDKGLLVNAEVSFELEQVPEWTINDGFVDVLRPGRQSTINDPSLPGRTDTAGGMAGGTGEDEKKDQPGGGGGELASRSPNLNRCQRAYYYAGIFKQFQKRINEVNIFFGSRDDTRRIASEFLIKFQDAAQELGSGFAPTSEATEIYKKIEDILNPNRSGGRLDGGQIKGYVNGYINSAFFKAKFIYNNKQNCPNTAGKTVLERQPNISRPTNL